MTFKEMCELISEYWATLGIHKTWEQIWEYSPTGELFMIYEWYEQAKEWKDNKDKGE